MKNNLILFLVISLVFPDCRAHVSTQSKDSHFLPILTSSFLPTISLLSRTAREGDLSQTAVSTKPTEKHWGDIFNENDGLYAKLLLGGISGWIAGYSAVKVGKFAATAVTGGAILLAVANYNDLISINWDNINHGVSNISTSFQPESQSWTLKVGNFVRENRYTAGAFGVGFIVGVFVS